MVVAYGTHSCNLVLMNRKRYYPRDDSTSFYKMGAIGMELADPRLLTCAYIVLNKAVPTESDPLFPPNFCNTLFDSPQNTLVQSGPFGLEVVSPGKHSLRRFVFHPAKIQIITETAELLMKVAGRVMEQLRRSAFPLEPSAYGLNYEFDFKLSEGGTATAWLAKRFATPGLNDVGQASAKLQTIDLRLDGLENLRGLRFEPRTGSDDRVFVHTNLHYDESRLLQGEQLEHAVDQGFVKSLELVAKLLKM